ncbi:MAG: glycosyltransferase [Candidatus Hydrogenedentes bacterium]|nr:glycosyltransferase [Candidatus Hydrogenedentota bacterium]
MTDNDSTIERIGPARGIVFARNARSKSVPAPTLEQWLRLNRAVFKCEKVDVIARADDCETLRLLHAPAEALDVRLSLRVDCTGAPPSAASLRTAQLWDMCLCTPHPDFAELDVWLRTCEQAGLRARVQLDAPFDSGINIARAGELLARACAVNIVAADPFSTAPPARNALHSDMSAKLAAELAGDLASRGIEVNLVGFPFCAIPNDLWAHVVNGPQYFLDHQQYKREPFALAAALFRRDPMWVRLAIMMRLGQHTSTNNPIDRILLPWVMDHAWVRARVWALHKLTRHRRAALPASPAEAELEVERQRAARLAARGPVCGTCRLRRICAGAAPIERNLPGLAIVSLPGEDIVDPLFFSRAQHKYYDPLDAARRDAMSAPSEIAQHANAIVTNTPPAREIDSFEYKVDGTWSWQLPGSLRWFSFAGGEKLSTPLARLDPPFTLSVTFGGGIADYIGFALGRGCRLLCPMTAFTHRVVLHVESDGQYAFLRDGQAIRPAEFVGQFYAPTRLGKGIEPRIAAWNIDGTIGTQAVYIWQPGETRVPDSEYLVSIVIVCTRYSRRLQASLRNIAHQQGISMDGVEVIVAFVPGLDATNDVIDSMQLAYPSLTIVPTPFAPEFANTKGLMLNECLDKARGDWVMVLDADIVLAPDMLARLTALPADCKFAIPDGRKMLSRETTARVLLGDITPWESWHELLEGAGEYRMREADGVPVGYCQCVRRECLDRVRYEELHHFEGADWKFGKDMRDAFGMEYRLDGTPVLHLDHGSSNWYGASRHY